MKQLPQPSQVEEEETRLDPKVVELVEKLSETSSLVDQLEALTKGVGLRSRELAAVANVSRATLSRLRRDDGAERPPQLDDLRAIVSYMVGTGALRPRSVGGWLRSRNEGLGLQRPLDVLADGEFALVLSAAEAACGGRLPVKREPQAASDTGRAVFSAVGVGADPEPPTDPDLTGSPAG
jgi:transcriptional regulator with XRE-family HTH domain